MNVPARVPSSPGSASRPGAWRTTASGAKPSSSSLVGVDEHRPREQRVVRARRHDAHRDAVRRVGAGERVDDVEVALAEVTRRPSRAARSKLLRLERLVDLAPPDAVLGAGLAHDELVLGRAARVLAGVDDERPALGEHALAARERRR